MSRTLTSRRVVFILASVLTMPALAQTISEMDDTCYGLQLSTADALNRRSLEEARAYVTAARYIRKKLNTITQIYDCYEDYFREVENFLTGWQHTIVAPPKILFNAYTQYLSSRDDVEVQNDEEGWTYYSLAPEEVSWREYWDWEKMQWKVEGLGNAERGESAWILSVPADLGYLDMFVQPALAHLKLMESFASAGWNPNQYTMAFESMMNQTPQEVLDSLLR